MVGKAELSLNAGVDILIFANNLMYEMILQKKRFILSKGIAEGRISETKIIVPARVGRLKKEVIEDLCTCCPAE